MNYKKILAVVIAVMCVVVCVFTACSSEEQETTTETTTIITTDSAVIKNSDAIELIKSYSVEELGLEGTWDDYNFVAHNRSGVQVEDGVHDGYYIEVVVGTRTANSDNTTSIDSKGTYLISYNGDTVLKADKENNTYTPLADVHSVPEAASNQAVDGE